MQRPQMSTSQIKSLFSGLKVDGKHTASILSRTARVGRNYAWVIALLVFVPQILVLVAHHRTDEYVYHTYALAFWAGHPRFHTLPHEYPPLSIAPFSLTLLPPLSDYPAIFAFWMSLLALLGYIAFARLVGDRRASIYAGYLALGALYTMVVRYDLVPALATITALWATKRRRFGLAYTFLAIGILLKLYPLFLVPIVAIEQWRVLTESSSNERFQAISHYSHERSRRLHEMFRQIWMGPATRRVLLGVCLCVGTVLLGFLGAAILSRANVLSSVTVASSRLLQIESVPATFLWLGTFVGMPAHAVFTVGLATSMNYVGPMDSILKPTSTLALFLGCLYVYWRQARTKLSAGEACLACLCVVILTNKVFSPQYLIWVLPFVALIEGWNWCWIAICLLTSINYPILYRASPAWPTWQATGAWPFMLVIAVRNGLVAYVTMRSILRPSRQPQMFKDAGNVASTPSIQIAGARTKN